METVYSDLDQDKLSIDPLVYNIQDIEQSIDNILITTPSERFFLPEFGCALRSCLFDLATSNNTFRLYETIRSAILRWEERVKIDESKSYTRFDRNSNTLIINFVFLVPDLDIKEYNYSRSVNITRLMR